MDWRWRSRTAKIRRVLPSVPVLLHSPVRRSSKPSKSSKLGGDTALLARCSAARVAVTRSCSGCVPFAPPWWVRGSGCSDIAALRRNVRVELVPSFTGGLLTWRCSRRARALAKEPVLTSNGAMRDPAPDNRDRCGFRDQALNLNDSGSAGRPRAVGVRRRLGRAREPPYRPGLLRSGAHGPGGASPPTRPGKVSASSLRALLKS